MHDFLPYIQTNLTTNEIISLGTQLLLSGERDIEQLQLPQTELSYGSILNDGLYYLVPVTLEDNVMWSGTRKCMVSIATRQLAVS